MDSLKMNMFMGDKLREICYAKGYRDKHALVAKTGIRPNLLIRYFNGDSDIPAAHLEKLAKVCGYADVSEFKAEILSANDFLKRDENVIYKTDREKFEEEMAAHRAAEIEAEERRKKYEAEYPEKVEEERRRAGFCDELKNTYGINAKVYRDGLPKFLVEEYAHPLRYIMNHIEHEVFLPNLSKLLVTYKDEDLIYEDENALMWASSHKMVYEKLLLLKDRKDFIASHIHDRGPNGMTALHYAARGQDDLSSARAIRLLVEWGADVNAQDKSLWTPLHEAARINQNNDCRWRALAECGADGSLKTNDGRTARQIHDYQDALDAW